MKNIHFPFSNKVLAACQYFVCFFLVTTTFSCCKVIEGKFLKITPCDTMQLQNTIDFVTSFYNAEYKTQVNCYMTEPINNIHSISQFAFCIDSILPTALFPFIAPLSNFLLEDTNAFLYCKSGDENNIFLRVNNKGSITDTLYSNFGAFKGEPLIFNSWMVLLPIPKGAYNRNYYTYLGIHKESNYQRSLSTRMRIFSSQYLSEISVTQDSILLVHFEKSLHYPSDYLSKNFVYVSYWPSRVGFNKSLDIVAVYPYIDSIFITRQDGSAAVYPFTSKLHKKQIESFDNSNLYDFPYINEYVCRNHANTNFLYDSYRDYYYIINIGTVKYENRDGTTNSTNDAPWSITITDGNFHQLDEIAMPKYLSRKNIMITPEGLAIYNNKLSLKNNNAPVYVTYKLEKK